jgi:anti-sigma regulatory factor (Ser/Thr protein kinase)
MGSLDAERFEVTAPGGETPSPSLREVYPAMTDSIPVARNAITDFAMRVGISGEQLDAVRLATSEALTNVVQYAYPARFGHIHVTGRVAGGELWVLIGDNGCGFHAGSGSDGLGLGLALINRLTDGFSVAERSSGGTELRLRFVIDQGDAPADQPRGSVSSAIRPASSRFSTTT